SKERNLQDAVLEIKQACEFNNYPFFFIVGAGISTPSVPLAGEIINECKSIARKYGIDQTKNSSGNMDEYSYWFEKALPHRKSRQEYLSKLIKNKSVTPANLRLAQILSDRKIGNLVITPNFDDFLSRALHLFGCNHIVSDHPQVLGKIDEENNDLIQIVHVHGTYLFYDCCNLGTEIKERAEHQSMSFFLSSVLKRRSPIVVGYSGWEEDVIMKSIKQRLQEPILPYKLFWFCYKPEQIKTYPDWLKNHRDVVFVVSDEYDFSVNPNINANDNNDDDMFEEEDQNLTPSEAKQCILTAQEVFDSIIESFPINTPTIKQNPIEHLIQSLDNNLPDKDNSMFLFDGLIDELKHINYLYLEWKRQRENENNIEQQIGEVKEFIRKSMYTSAIERGVSISNVQLNSNQKEDLYSALFTSLEKEKDHEIKLKACDYLFDLSSSMFASDPQNHIYEMNLFLSLFNKGLILGKNKREEEAISVYDQLIAMFGESKNIKILARLIDSYNKKSSLYFRDKKYEEAIKIIDEAIDKYSSIDQDEIQVQIVYIMSNKAYCLKENNNIDKSLKVYNDLVESFIYIENIKIERVVAYALNRIAVTKNDLPEIELDEILNPLNTLIEKFSGYSDSRIQKEIAIALYNKAYYLFLSNMMDESLKIIDQLSDEFSHSNDQEVLLRVARGFILKSGIYFKMDKSEESLEMLQLIINKFGDMTDSSMKDVVRRAYFNKIIVFSNFGHANDAREAITYFMDKFGEFEDPEVREMLSAADNIMSELNADGNRIEKDEKDEKD
ncbi:MAG: SIR2 family protein, partial [Methanobacterium sp.]